MDVDFGNILSQTITQTLTRIVHLGVTEMPNLLFCGPAGCGKTSAAQILVSKLYGTRKTKLVTEIRSASITIEDVRTTIKTKSQHKAIDKKNGKTIPRCIIVEKAEGLTSEAQWALRRILERFTATCRYIFITTEKHKLIAALLSRLTFLNFPKFTDSQLTLCLESQCLESKISYEPGLLQYLVKECEGNARKSMNTLGHLVLLSKGKPLSHEILHDIVGSLNEEEKSEILGLRESKDAVQLALKLANRKVNLKQFLLFLLETVEKLEMKTQDIRTAKKIFHFKIFLSKCDLDIAKGTVPDSLLCSSVLLEYLFLI